MVRRRSLANRAELSRNHLCLPFRIKRDAEDGFALITQELQYGHRSLGSFIASSQGFDDNVGLPLFSVAFLRASNPFGSLSSMHRSIRRVNSPLS
jgi:hypothetical protein